MISEVDPSCIACGSKELCFGYLSGGVNIFVPSNIFTIYGIKTRSFVCLNCGFITQYIPKGKVEKLRQKMKEKL